ncbi:alpha/beta fold hydrolase [Streptomyces sp. NPDC127092]|uniref:alpha/beta fold hydrolase n=1 Tax=Streptomyces sp. NPDC127092 TaxID=3347135 RepID=UPI003656785B
MSRDPLTRPSHPLEPDTPPAPAVPPFDLAYDAVLAKWPPGTTTATVPTPYGTTHVIGHGPAGAPPVLLLAGGGATATGWYGTAAALGGTHRVHAVDLVGEAGRSVADPRRPLRTAADLVGWLDALLHGLGIPDTRPVGLAGHSYGAWIALQYALAAPGRVDRLVLLDPTNCFTGFAPRFLLRALPVLLRPTPARGTALLDWETRGATLDPDWRRLHGLATAFPAVRPVNGPRPTGDRLGTLKPPALVLLAARTRVHDPYAVERWARAAVPGVETAILPDATHFTLPVAAPPDTHARIARHLAG